MKKIILILAISSSFGMNAQSTDAKTLQKAFKDSYTFEQTANYAGAIDALKPYYTEGSYEINLRLGWLNYMLGKFNESVTYYEKSIKLMPYSIEAKLGVVYPLTSLKNWNAIVVKYTEILKIAPENTTVNYKLGLIYYYREKFVDAKKYFDKFLNLYPFEYDALIMSAWTYYKIGQLNEAKSLFNKALLVRPSDSSALEGLSYIK